MPQKSWTVQLEDGTHTVEFDKRWSSSQRVIRVDGQVVLATKAGWINTGSDDAFVLGAHQAVLHTRTNGLTFNYDLSVDGQSVQSGRPVAQLTNLPKWIWFFIVACGIIPLFTLGGAIPIVIGLGGASACAVVSRHPTRSVRMKAVWAAGITMAAWAAAIAFVVLAAGGLALLNVSQPDWQTYQSPAGRYSILMPGRPKEQTQAFESAVGTLDLHIATYENRSGAYLVMYVDYPADLVAAGQASAILDGAAQGAVANVDGQLTRQQAVSLGAAPGREIEFDAAAQGAQPATRIKVRYYLVGRRLYQVMVVAPQAQGLPADAPKFLDSFNLNES
jgi:hypothetical protein